MRILGKYHSRNIHQRTNEDGEQEECGFHPLLVCSCGACGKKSTGTKGDGKDGNTIGVSSGSGGGGSDDVNVDSGDSGGDSDGDIEDVDDSDGDSEESSQNEDSSDDEESLSCNGKPYVTRSYLSCPLHSVLYEIECDRVAEKAKEVIHDEMGRGHSNLPESKFNVLTRCRTKSINLHQLHYEFSTNCGLCQSNMSFMYREVGAGYHWMHELLLSLGLPIPDGIEEIWYKENERRMKALQRKQSDQAKTARAHLKQKRCQERKKRLVMSF